MQPVVGLSQTQGLGRADDDMSLESEVLMIPPAKIAAMIAEVDIRAPA